MAMNGGGCCMHEELKTFEVTNPPEIMNKTKGDNGQPEINVLYSPDNKNTGSSEVGHSASLSEY